MMKYFKSYPCQYEDISKLPLDVLEDIMIRIGGDPYLTQTDKAELLDLYIRQRWRKKMKSFVYSKDNIERIEEMNRTLIRQTTEIETSAWEIWQQEREEMKRIGKSCNIQVRAKLLIPGRMYKWRPSRQGNLSKESKIWWILSDGYDSPEENKRNILPSVSEYGRWKEEYGLEQRLKVVLWGISALNEPEEEWGWEDIMGIDHKKTRHIRFCRTFSEFLSQERFSLQDILSIEKFTQIIEVKYDVL